MNARSGLWQEAQATVPSADRRGSKKSFSPSAIFSGVCGLSAGISRQSLLDRKSDLLQRTGVRLMDLQPEVTPGGTFAGVAVAITGDGPSGSGLSADATREPTKSSPAAVLKTAHIPVID